MIRILLALRYNFITRLYEKIRYNYMLRKKLKEIKKQDPFIYK